MTKGDDKKKAAAKRARARRPWSRTKVAQSIAPYMARMVKSIAPASGKKGNYTIASDAAKTEATIVCAFIAGLNQEVTALLKATKRTTITTDIVKNALKRMTGFTALGNEACVAVDKAVRAFSAARE